MMTQEKSCALATSWSLIILAITTGIVPVISQQKAFAQDEDDDIAFATNVEMIKARLRWAAINVEANNADWAKAHIFRATTENYDSIGSRIATYNYTLHGDFRNSLSILFNDVGSISKSEFNIKVSRFNAALDAVTKIIISEDRWNDPRFNGKVVISLLQHAQETYEQGVSEDGTVIQTTLYQESLGYMESATSHFFLRIANYVSNEQARGMQSLLVKLDGTARLNGPPDDVKEIIQETIDKLSKDLAIEVGSTVDGRLYIDRIEILLNQSLDKYRQGDYEGSRILVIDAYANNFEKIRVDIEEDDPELMQRIDSLLKEDLIKSIDEKKPVEEIESQVTMVINDLESARSVVIPEFPIHVGLIVGTIGLAVFLSRMRIQRT